MKKLAARKILLPRLELTEVTDSLDKHAIRIPLPTAAPNEAYYVRSKHIDTPSSERVDSKPGWMGSQFNLFPVVLNSDGSPWAEANIYLLSRIESSLSPAMATYASIADSLAGYRRFLDETGIDWTEFPEHKLKRPTYRYHGFLKYEIADGKMKASTAKRRMSAVISFYTWLKQEGTLNPSHSPWKESDQYIQLTDSRGLKFSKQITSKDISIKSTPSIDPYDDRIFDGGKLRPLTKDEQSWLVNALVALGNTEMLLIHLLGLLTGARIQTILTLRIKHLRTNSSRNQNQEIRLIAGGHSDIDTKNNKKIVIHIPVWLHQKLQVYAISEGAKKRRMRAQGGDNENQYLFLSIRGAPLYQSKSDNNIFDEKNQLRHLKSGQAVRQYIKDRVIPYIRDKQNTPMFSYQFHDTRATFGMNLTDFQLERVSSGYINLHQAREFVKARMCHESTATTDRYLQYRSNLNFTASINIQYDSYLHEILTASEGTL